MKKFAILIFIIWLFSVSAFAQEAEKIDEFGNNINCGDFLARADNIYSFFKNSPDIKIYIVYYGGRYRKQRVFKKRTEEYEIKLKYPHRDDGLNWAKSIPLYLTTIEPRFPEDMRNKIKDVIFLSNGGYRENTEVEIWIVRKGDELPKPTPTIAEKDIRFRKDKPLRTPDYAQCYP